VAAAARLLDEGGPEAVTLRAVAQAVGISHNALPAFRDKRALLTAVARAGFRELGSSLCAGVRNGGSPLAALKLVVCLYFDFRAPPLRSLQALFSDPDVGARVASWKPRRFGHRRGGRLVGAAAIGRTASGQARRVHRPALRRGAWPGGPGAERGGARAAKGMEAVDALPVLLLDLLATEAGS
jgi:AcrR family transcriptional regulator